MLVLYGAVEVALVLVAGASLYFAAYEYMFIGFCIDCYFAPEPYTFWYTLIMTGIVVAGLVLQPFITFRRDI
jgi:hypothetical protein